MKNEDLLHIVKSPRTEYCRAIPRWDEESFVLTIDFHYSNDSDNEQNLQQKINRSLGIRENSYQVFVGDLTIALDKKYRMNSLEIRSNPKNWEYKTLNESPKKIEDIYMKFETEYDENNIVYYRCACKNYL